MRFARRGDLDPASFGTCAVEELPAARGVEPHPGDILLLAKKKKMADPEPYKVTCVMSAAYAEQLRCGFQEVVGVAKRRPVAAKVAHNIATVGVRCQKQGIIDQQALAYLQGWSEGTWRRLKRQTSYAHLRHRGTLPCPMPQMQGSWIAPRRVKHVDLTLPSEGDPDLDDDSGSDNAEVDLVLDS